MSLIRNVYTVLKTSSQAYSGTSQTAIRQIVNQAGTDRMNLKLPHGNATYTSGSMSKSDTYFLHQQLPIGGLGYITKHNLEKNDLYIRFLITSSNYWRPYAIFVFGSGDGDIIPLAYQDSFTHLLSTDTSEGLASIPVRRIVEGDDDMLLDKILVVVRTDEVSWARTNDRISIDIHSALGNHPDVHAEGKIQGIDSNSVRLLKLTPDGDREKRYWNNFKFQTNGFDACKINNIWVFGMNESDPSNPRMSILARLDTPIVLSRDEDEGDRYINLPRF